MNEKTYISKRKEEINFTWKVNSKEFLKKEPKETCRYARRQARSSKKEHRVNALALRADERRDKLRKAAVRSKYPATRGCLNGETRLSEPQSPYDEYIVMRREPPELKHLSRERKRKKHRFPKSRRANGKEPKPGGMSDRGNGLTSRKRNLAERFWESLPKSVKAAYAKEDPTGQYPEYYETRGTL